MTIDRDRLRDIAEHLSKIEQHRPDSLADLAGDEVLTAAIIRWIEIVGEAATNMTESTRATHPDLPWRQMIGMRNQLIHRYPSVDLDLVWGVVERDGPELREQVERILDEEDGS